MKKKKQRNKVFLNSTESENRKIGVVVSVSPASYNLVDHRLNKPILHEKHENGQLVGSMLVQEFDTIKINSKEINYFSPNNIAILLSVNNSYATKAKSLYNQIETELDAVNDATLNEKLPRNSKFICDYIEAIQISIVFGFTALETFANLSIPSEYKFSAEKNKKGVIEVYDKEAIERWLTLKAKFKDVLSEIFSIAKIENNKWWTDFTTLEEYRNDIIHQKSITITDFYKTYFQKNIFRVCQCPKDIIKYYYDIEAQKNQTNSLWPWLVDEKNYIPINTDFESKNFEVVGNLFEGIKKR